MKKVGIITWHQYYNFGSALQAFALREQIEKMDYDAEIINYQLHSGMSKLSVCVRCLIGNICCVINVPKLDVRRYSFLRFQEYKMKLNEEPFEKIKN